MGGENRRFCRLLPALLCAGILCQTLSGGSEGIGKTGLTDGLKRMGRTGLTDGLKRMGRTGLTDGSEGMGRTGLSGGSEKPGGTGLPGSSLELPPVLPQRYDARERGHVPSVKSQGSYGTCWALAASSALEAALLPDVRIQFSADHMALNNRFVTSLSDGGDYIMVMAYLSGWQGPVTEEEDPYGDAHSPDGLLPAVHVQEIRLLEGCGREEMKEAVFRYGAVQTSLYMSRGETDPERGYYNPSGAAWYYPQEKTQNHDVIILGWDDGYSRFHFSQIPPEDGAFICQNSWGEKFGEEGIFYVSYADANIARTGLAYSRVEAPDNYDFLYQTDDCGWVGQQGYSSETCWFANVYTAGENNGLNSGSDTAGEDGSTDGGLDAVGENNSTDGGLDTAGKDSSTDGGLNAVGENNSTDGGLDTAGKDSSTGAEPDAAGENENRGEDSLRQLPSETVSGKDLELAAFGFYVTGPDTTCELYLAHDFEGPDSFSDMKFLQKNVLDQAGYYTVDLDEPEKLYAGERFAMIVKITTPGGKNPAAVEYRADACSQNVVTAGKEGYLSQDGTYWENTEQRFGSNVCLKGYVRFCP